MNRKVKWVLATVVAAIIIFAIAAIVLPRLVDPNRYKAQISAAVLRETGKELTIGGDIEWRLFPSVGLGVHEVSLREPSDAAKPVIASIDEARVSLALMPLLRKNVEVGRIDLKGASFSWPDSTSPLSRVAISQANLSLAPASQSITPAMSASGLNEQPFDLSGDFSMLMADPALSGSVKFSMRLIPLLTAKQVKLEGMEMSFTGQLAEGDNALPLESTSSIAAAEFDLVNDRASIKDFIFTLFDLDLRGQVDLKTISTSPAVTGQVKLAEFNPRVLQRKLGMEELKTSNPQAFSSLSGEARFDYSDAGLQLSDALMQLDETQMAGNFRLENFDAPVIDFGLQVDTINLDDYSSAENSGEVEQGTRNADLGAAAIRGFAGGGNLRIGSLTASGLTATDIEASVSADRAATHIRPLNATVYGGKASGDIVIGAHTGIPRVTSNLELTEVRLGELLEDLEGEASLRGMADVFLQLEFDIATGQSAIRGLRGDMGLLVTEGSIVGLDLAGILRTVSTAIAQSKGVDSQADESQKTEFAELSMTGVFEGGILKSDDLLIQSAILSSTGKGQINLADETLDFVIYPALAGETGIEALQKVTGFAVPVRLSGSLDSPSYEVDMEAAIELYQQALMKKTGEELLKKLLK
jgi:AsmA protein